MHTDDSQNYVVYEAYRNGIATKLRARTSGHLFIDSVLLVDVMFRKLIKSFRQTQKDP